MERTDALNFLDLARTIASPMTHDDAENIWRSYVIDHANDAIAALSFADSIDDPQGAKALWSLRHLCPVCFNDKQKHQPDCVLGE